MGCCCSVDVISLVFCGLSNSGKSTIIGQIEFHSFRVTSPTLTEEISYTMYHDKQVRFYDIPGNDFDLWTSNLDSAHGIVFVVDSRNRHDLKKFLQTANKVLDKNDSKKLPVLIFINWCNVGDSISETELRTSLKINSRGDIDVFFQECNAKSGEGISEGYHWIVEKIDSTFLLE